jgi:putative transposase
MANSSSFDFDDFKQKAMKDLYAGKLLTGENGIFTPLLKHFLESTLQGEMSNYLTVEKSEGKSNRRNELSKKSVRNGFGQFDLESP